MNKLSEWLSDSLTKTLVLFSEWNVVLNESVEWKILWLICHHRLAKHCSLQKESQKYANDFLMKVIE